MNRGGPNQHSGWLAHVFSCLARCTFKEVAIYELRLLCVALHSALHSVSKNLEKRIWGMNSRESLGISFLEDGMAMGTL